MVDGPVASAPGSKCSDKRTFRRRGRPGRRPPRGGHLRIGLDATPLLGQPTGVGRYTRGLLGALAAPAAPAEELVAVAVTLRGRAGLRGALPAGVSPVGPPVPARLLHRLWARGEHPGVRLLAGAVDVFHATNFVLPPTGRAAGVVTVHDLSFLRTPDTVSAASAAYAHLVPRSLRRAGAVCVPSAAVAEEVTATYPVPPDQVVVTPLGVGDEWFTTTAPDAALRARLGIPEEYLLFSGSLEPRKNLPFLLRVHRELDRSRPGWPPLVLTGPPGWGPRLDLADHRPGSVVLTGYLPDDELRQVVAGSRAVLFPTRYEGFGLPPLEAFATGAAVVASDLPVIREVVGDQAVLAPLGDHDAWAEALLRVVQDPGDGAGRRRRARQLDWATTAASTRAAYALAVTGP